MVELLVAMIAVVPLFFGIAWIAKVIDMRIATVAAARALAFECTVRPDACTDASARMTLAAEIRHRHFSDAPASVRSDDAASGAARAPERVAFWVDRRGDALLERYDDVSIAVAAASFDSPLAFAGSVAERSFDGAVRILSTLGGPGRFGLDIDGGLLEARVRADVARSRPSDGWVTRLLAMPLTLDARLTLLTDAWAASGPYGPEPHTVESRVEAGARLPGIDAAIAALWLPVRGLVAIGGFLRTEPLAGEFRWHEIDVDLVPPDRIGDPTTAGPIAPATPPVPPDQRP